MNHDAMNGSIDTLDVDQLTQMPTVALSLIALC
jgi:hypothetical protein